MLNTSSMLVAVYKILQILNYAPRVPEGRLLCPVGLKIWPDSAVWSRFHVPSNPVIYFCKCFHVRL